MFKENIYKQDLGYRVRSVGNKIILFGSEGAFELNETGLLIWDHINGSNRIDDILNVIVDTYNCSKEDATRDLNNFIEFLLQIKAIKES